MAPHLFNKIMHDVCNYDRYFVQKSDNVGVLGLLPEQKLTVVSRMLTYGSSAGQKDEIARAEKSTILEVLTRVYHVVKTLNTTNYRCSPSLQTTIGFCKKVKLEVFQAWLEALIASIGNGRIVQVPGKETTRIGKVIELTFLRLLHPLIHGFGTPSLVSQELKMTSMFSINLRYSTRCWEEKQIKSVHNQQYCVRVSLLPCRRNLPAVDNLCQNNSKFQNGEGSTLFRGARGLS